MLRFTFLIVALVFSSLGFAGTAIGAWAKVDASSLNVRSAPSLQAQVRTRVNEDAVVFATPSGAPGWVFIKNNETAGYVSAEYLRIIRITSGDLGNRQASY